MTSTRIVLTALACVVISSCITNSPPLVDNPPTDPPVTIKPVDTVPEVAPDPDKPGEYKVSTEQYQATFDDIKKLILKLNKLIQDKSYSQWITYLDEAYLAQNGNPENLKKLSESPILKKLGIKLRDLKDYFNFVVVPSRSNATLERIAFINKDLTNVIAYTNLEGSSTILYQLKYSDGQWKISNW